MGGYRGNRVEAFPSSPERILAHDVRKPLGEADMSKLHFRKRFAHRPELRHSRPCLRPVMIEPVSDLRFPDFVIVMKALALATVCLLVAIPLLVLCGLLLYSLCEAI